MSRTDSSFLFRCGVASGVLVLFGLGASWVVGVQARNYRESLATRRAPTIEGVAQAPEPPAASSEVPTTAVAPDPIARAEATPAPPAEADAAEPAPEVAEAPPPPAPPDPGAPGPDQVPNIWEWPDLKRVWDIDHITFEQAYELGTKLHQQLILQQNPHSNDGHWKARVQRAAEAIRKVAPPSKIRYTFTVLESNAFNAFALPGGYVYVTQGLVDSLGEDEDYALEFALAHEMAHVELHHALQCLRDPKFEEIPTSKALYLIIIPLGFPKEMEYEADRWALDRMAELGHDQRESLAFLRKLVWHANVHHYPGGERRPDLESGDPLIENHLAAHVSAQFRLEKATESLNAHPARAR
jgi:hypothetical protein